MEQRRMDGDLYLLILIHRQLREAGFDGVENPTQMFFERDGRLVVRVVEASRMEEVDHSGFYQGHELIESARTMLIRLEENRYVALSHDDEEEFSGTVSITEKGLSEIGRREAIESNLPRSFKMWEIFPFSREARHKRIWRANWEGRQITVHNRRILSGREDGVTAYLEVDQRRPRNYRTRRHGNVKDIYGELPTASGSVEIHAHIGPTTPFGRTGCLIAVDGVVIGGDIGKRFRDFEINRESLSRKPMPPR